MDQNVGDQVQIMPYPIMDGHVEEALQFCAQEIDRVLRVQYVDLEQQPVQAKELMKEVATKRGEASRAAKALQNLHQQRDALLQHVVMLRNRFTFVRKLEEHANLFSKISDMKSQKIVAKYKELTGRTARAHRDLLRLERIEQLADVDIANLAHTHRGIQKEIQVLRKATKEKILHLLKLMQQFGEINAKRIKTQSVLDDMTWQSNTLKAKLEDLCGLVEGHLARMKDIQNNTLMETNNLNFMKETLHIVRCKVYEKCWVVGNLQDVLNEERRLDAATETRIMGYAESIREICIDKCSHTDNKTQKAEKVQVNLPKDICTSALDACLQAAEFLLQSEMEEQSKLRTNIKRTKAESDILSRILQSNKNRIDGALKDEAASKRQYKDAFNELRCLQDFLQSMIALPTAVATEIVTSQSNTSNADRVSNAYKLEECQDADSGKVPNSRTAYVGHN